MKDLIFSNRKGLIKSTINNHQSSIGLGIKLRSLLFLAVALMVSGNVWGGDRSAYAWPNTDKTKTDATYAGGVYVSQSGNSPSKDSDYKGYDESSYNMWYTCKYYAKAWPGYKFMGWYNSSAYSSKTSGDNPYEKSLGKSATLILYAKFDPISYTIAFNGNGATGGSTASISAKYDVAVNLTQNGFSRTGYSFAGWKTENTGDIIADKASVLNLTATDDATVKMYAQWTANTYNVVFNKNDNQAEGTMSNQQFTYDQQKALTSIGFTNKYIVTYSDSEGTGTPASANAARAFSGWATSASGSVLYTNGQSVSNLATSGNCNLYAKWGAASAITLPNPTHSGGKTLEGWYNGTTRVGGAGDSYTPTGNVTLTAKWVTPNYTLTFNLNGGSSVTPASKTVTLHQTYGDLPTITTTLHSTKLFSGWYTAADGGTEVTSSTTVTTASNHSIYAHWTDVQTKVLGYVINELEHYGGEISMTKDQKTISQVTSWHSDTDYGGPATGKSHTYYLFARAFTGYDFTGWKDASGNLLSSSTTYTPTVTVSTIAEGNPNPKIEKFYAIFTIHKWTLGWAGFTSSEATTSYTAAGTKDYGSAITAPTLRRYGYKHNGWSPAFQSTMPDNNVTYTAQWDGVTVSGATAQTKNFTAQTQTQTATLTFPVTNATDKNDFNAPTLSGDAGWTISSWNYSNDNVTVTLSYTATENSTTSGNHVTTVTLKAKNNASATGQVTANVNMTPSITSTIASSYYVEDASINLNTAWASTSNGSKTYSIVSFSPASGEQSGSTAPAISSNVLSLGKAGTLVIKLVQAAGTSSKGYEGTKTITINRITNTLTADATHSMYVGDTWNNVYSNKNSNAPITTTTSASTWAYFNVSDNKIVAQNTTNAGDDSKSVTIKIEQAETYKYTSVSKSIAVTVNKKTPSVSWTPQTYYINSSYSNVFTFTGEATLFSSSSSVGTVAEMTGLTSMQTFNKSAETTITVTATENYMWKGDTFTKKITPNLGDAHVTFAYTQSLFDNTSITHASNAEWPSGKAYVRIGGQEDYSQEEGTVAIKFSGIPDKMLFNYSTSSTISGIASSPKWRIYESTDGSNWGTEIWSDSKKSSSWVNDDINYNVSLQLKPETRYLKLYYYGYCAGDYRFSVSELQYFKTDISSISYDPVTIGSTAPIKSFKVQHCNAGYQTSVVAPAHFQVSTNQSDWSDEVVISTNATAVTGGDKMGEPTVYVKYLADAVGSHNGSIQVKNNLLADQTVSVSGSTIKMIPPITWLIADQIANGEEIAKSDIATTESSLAIDFTSSNTDVAYFEDGMLIAQAAGTTTITATITGNALYADRVETKGITVTNKTIQTITWNQNFDLKPYGSAREKLTATASSGLAVEYSTDDSNVASITKEGNDYYVNFVNVGQTNIYANQAGDITYAAASTKTKFVMVYDASQPCPSEYNLHTEKTDIKDDYEEYDVKIPQSFYCETHANSLASQNFYVKQYVNNDWQTIYDEFISSGDYQPVTLTAANGLSENATKIRYGTNASRGYKVQNVKYTQKTSTSVDKSSLTFSAFPSSPTVPQTIKVTNYNRMILVTTNDANFVVSPNQLGACGSKTETDLSIYYNAPAAEGTYPAKLNLKDNTGVTMQTIDLSATVAKLSQTVAFSGLGSAYSTTDEVTLAATSNKSAEKERNFTYTVVSTNGVASITGNTLTFLKSGSATIRVTEAGDNMYNSAYADATLEVSKVTPTIATVPTAAAINYGNPLSASTLSGGKATTTLHGATGAEVFGTWAWHEPTAVKTANSGIAQAYQVDFTPDDGGMYNTTNCQVYVKINQIAQTINWNQTIGDQVYNGSLTLTASNGTAGGGTISYTWTPDLATISGSTLTFNKGVGTITVTAHAASNANYVEATTSKSFNIVRINPTITKKDINDTYLVDADQIDLQSLWTTNGDGVITYSKVSFSPSSTINGTATEPFISDNRYLSFGQAGTLVIRLSMAQGSYYNAITDEKTITINKRTPNIEFVNNTYYFNSTYPSVYTVNDGDATLCTLTSSDQDVAVVEGTGIKTYNKPASTKLTLTSAENYKWAKKTIETTITPTADPNVPAFYYTEAFFNHAGVTYSKVGVPEWSYAGYNPEGMGKLTLKSNDPNNAFSSVAFKVGGAPSKIFFEWSNNGTTDGIFALWAATSPAALGVVWNITSNNTGWNPVTYTCNGTDNLFQWAFTNHYSGGEFANMKIYGDAYILAADSVSMNYGTIQIYHPSVNTFKLAHANIGYNTTVSSNDPQFEVSLDGTNYASSQTISSYANQVTGGGKQGVITISVKYVTSAAGTHNGTITISDDLSHTTSVSVTGTTVDKYDPVITNTIKDTYMIGDPTIDLNALWTSNSNGVRSYEITSWQPSGEHNEGAVAPSITDKKLSLGQAGTVQLKLSIQGTQAYKSATDTKTIVIKKYDPVATFSSQSYYYNGTYNNIYSVTAGESSLFSLTSSDPTIASVVGNSLTTFDKAGSTTLTVTATENYIWNPKTFTKVVTPTKESNHITFDYTEALYQDGAVTVQKSATTSWNGYLRLGDPDEEDDRQENYADIKFVGYPKSLTIQYSKGGGDASGTWQIFESTDGINWTNTWSADYGSRDWTSAEVPFKSYQSRYVRFWHYGLYAGDYIIRINELEYYRRSGSGTLDFKTNKQGVVPAVQYFNIEHCNAGYVTTITAPAHYLVSLSENGTYTQSIDYSSNANPNTGGDKLSLFRVYVKYLADAEGTHGGNVVVNNNKKGNIEIPVTGETQAKLTTTLYYIGKSSYSVDTANIHATDLFEVRKNDGTKVEGAYIKLIKTSDAGIITLNEDSTAINPQCGGSATITASYAGDDDNYKPATPLGQSITIDRLADEVTFDNARSVVLVGDEFPITEWASCKSGTTISYSSDNLSVAKIENGKLIALAKGTAVLTATSAGNCTYYGTSTTMTLTVKNANDPCGTLLLDKTSTFKLGSTSGTVDYTISDGEMDRLTFKIWNYQGASNVSVGVRLQDIDGTTITTFNYTQDDIPHDEPSSPNKTIDLKPYPNTKKLHWYGSQAFNIKVSENKVYLQSYLNVNFNSITMSTVKGCEQATGQVEISYSDLHRIQFSQTDTNFRYEVWKNNVILPDGFDNDCGDHGTYLVKFFYTPKTKGDYSNDVTFSSGTFSQTVHISGTATAPDREIVWDLPLSNEIYATESDTLDAYAKTICQEGQAGEVYYTANASLDVVKIEGNVVTFKQAGSVTITAHVASSTEYGDAPTVSKVWNVKKVALKVVKLPTILSTITYRDNSTIVSWDEDWLIVDTLNNEKVDGSLIYVSPSQFSAAGPANITFNFNPTDLYTYEARQVIVPIIVQKGMPEVTWATANNPTYNSNLVLGDVALNGGSAVYRTINVPGTFTWETPGQALQAGDNQTFKVIFTPTDTANLKCDTSTITINVLKATPAVVWGEDARVYPLGDDIANKFVVKDAVTGALIAGATTTMAIKYEQTIATIINEGQTIHPITKNEMVVITASYVTNNTNYVSHTDTVQLTFRAPDFYVFTGKGDWTDVERWNVYPPVKSADETPLESNNILVKGDLTISSGEKEMLSLTYESGSITIAPTAGMTVGEGGVSGLTDPQYLRIQSTKQNQGFFRVSPKATTAEPYATVEFATKATLDEGYGRNATMQYFGSPVRDYKFAIDYITWLYDWQEKSGWIGLKQSETVNYPMELFHGYAVSQYGKPVYEFPGQLITKNYDVNLTYTAGGMQGSHIVANSFAAPIDVNNFTDEDFTSEKVHKTFYLFNAGSWNEWKGGKDSTSFSGEYGNTPGSYYAMPIGSSKYIEGHQHIIPPITGFVVATSESATMHLNYEKHVWNAKADNMNLPVRAPQRDMSANQEENYANQLSHRVVVGLTSKNSGHDHVTLLEHKHDNHFTTGYDNGYDAPKMGVFGIANIYTTEADNMYSISATNELEGMYIGILSGEDDAYELTVRSVIGDSLYILDQETNVRIPIVEGQKYQFNMSPNSENDYRFIIKKQAKTPFVPTGNGNIQSNAYIWVDAEYVHIENATANSIVGMYAADGKLIFNETFNRRADYSIRMLSSGVYLVYVDGKPFKFVKK